MIRFSQGFFRRAVAISKRSKEVRITCELLFYFPHFHTMKKIWILSFAEEKDNSHFYTLSSDYAKMIESIWHIATIIPFDSTHLPYFVEQLDGFIIPWGRDVCPETYYEEPLGAKDYSCIQDEGAFHLTKLAIQSKKPLLWICRGMQLINVYLWGTLYQHLENSNTHDQYEKRYETVHSVYIEPHSYLSKIFPEIISVNSAHHQAIKKLWKWLDSIACDSTGNVIEAIKHATFPIFWTQWHPEKLPSNRAIFSHIFW